MKRFRLFTYSVPVLILTLFHAALLLRRVGDASIAHPTVLGRWAFSVALLVLLFVAGRAKRTRQDRRLAITFWVLAAVLHLTVPSAARYSDAADPMSVLVESVLAAAPAIVFLAALVKGNRAAPQPESRWTAVELPRKRSCELLARWGDRAPPALA